MKQIVLLGGYSSEVPPLPIPNREVKLTYADGTAYLGGRVGSRLFKPSWIIPTRLFLCIWGCGDRGTGGDRECDNKPSRLISIRSLKRRSATYIYNPSNLPLIREAINFGAW